MSRPSKNTDRLLIKAGRDLICEKGVSELSIRGLAEKAGVNLGMFHYHFKSKNAFIRQVLIEIYEEFFRRFSLEVDMEGSLEERLKRALTVLGQFVRDNRELVLSFVKDVMGGEKAIFEFLDENFFRHAAVIMNLVKEGQKTGIFQKMPLPRAMAFLASCVAVPNLVVTVMERAGAKKPFNFALEMIKGDLLSNDGIAARVDMAIRGISNSSARGEG